MRLGNLTKAQQDSGTRLTFDQPVTPPTMPMIVTRDAAGAVVSSTPAWGRIAVITFEAAKSSPLRRYWTDLDWAMILSACQALDDWHSQDVNDRTAATYAAITATLKAVGADLTSRRRLGIFTEQANTSPASAGPAGARNGAGKIRNIRSARSAAGTVPATAPTPAADAPTTTQAQP